MKAVLKIILVSVSVTVNILFALFIIFAALSDEGALLRVSDMDTALREYTSGACIVSVPGDGPAVIFGPVEFTLAPGERAALQFSALRKGTQLNVALEPLYDREIIAVEQSPFGIFVTAAGPGETILQTITADGIRDIARVTVTERTF
jgi:hypothetical protein